MANEYFLLFKTAQAEMRCWKNFQNERKNEIVPIVELTRGRKKPGSGKGVPEEQWPEHPGIFDYQKNIDAVLELFRESTSLIVDITREPSLSCAELTEIASSDGAYQKWHDFCFELQKKGLDDLIPTILVNPSDGEGVDDYKENLKGQFDALASRFGAVSYRASVLYDTEFMYDIALLADDINLHMKDGGRFILIIDHEFIRTRTGLLHALRTSKIIQHVRSFVPKAEIVVLATSFPSNVTELGGEDEGAFRAEEVFLYDEIMRSINDNEGIYYGDYGSINPIRNDLVFARGGWRPRIDFPTKDRAFFYYREKRDGGTYAPHYASVARNVISDAKYDPLPGSWGDKRIVEAAMGNVPSSSPSYWISVRMEIFLQRQAARRFKEAD